MKMEKKRTLEENNPKKDKKFRTEDKKKHKNRESVQIFIHSETRVYVKDMLHK